VKRRRRRRAVFAERGRRAEAVLAMDGEVAGERQKRRFVSGPAVLPLFL
jgi:hypothetical protein